MDIFCKDRKLNISDKYLRPGNPFGGSCLPKDVRALQRTSAEYGLPSKVLEAVEEVNNAQKYVMLNNCSANIKSSSVSCTYGRSKLNHFTQAQHHVQSSNSANIP